MNIIHLQTGPLGVNTYIVPCVGVQLHEGDFAEKTDSVATSAVFVVDPGGDADRIIEAIEKYSATAQKNGETPVQYTLSGIVLTHGHFDHLGAVPALKKQYPSAVLCIHGEDSFYVGTTAYNFHHEDFSSFGAEYLVDQVVSTHPDFPAVDTLLTEGMKLPFAPEWIVLHTPGHSKGSVCVYNETEKLLITGDTLFASAYGRTDLRGGSFSELKKSLSRLLQLPSDVVVYPGHEEVTNIGREKAVQAF